jgi:hypothetical protein
MPSMAPSPWTARSSKAARPAGLAILTTPRVITTGCSIVQRVMPAKATPSSHGTMRQRRDGSRPSGNNSNNSARPNMPARGPPAATQAQSPGPAPHTRTQSRGRRRPSPWRQTASRWDGRVDARPLPAPPPQSQEPGKGGGTAPSSPGPGSGPAAPPPGAAVVPTLRSRPRPVRRCRARGDPTWPAGEHRLGSMTSRPCLSSCSLGVGSSRCLFTAARLAPAEASPSTVPGSLRASRQMPCQRPSSPGTPPRWGAATAAAAPAGRGRCV